MSVGVWKVYSGFHCVPMIVPIGYIVFHPCLVGYQWIE